MSKYPIAEIISKLETEYGKKWADMERELKESDALLRVLFAAARCAVALIDGNDFDGARKRLAEAIRQVDEESLPFAGAVLPANAEAREGIQGLAAKL